jgi:hypothetical protein
VATTSEQRRWFWNHLPSRNLEETNLHFKGQHYLVRYSFEIYIINAGANTHVFAATAKTLLLLCRVIVILGLLAFSTVPATMAPPTKPQARFFSLDIRAQADDIKMVDDS